MGRAAELTVSAAAGYELFDASFACVGFAVELVAARGPDAMSLAKSYGHDCVVVRCSDSVAIAGYWRRPGILLRKWRETMMPGVARATA